MPPRYQKRKKIAPGTHLNIGKRGVNSVTFGKRGSGLSVTAGKRGTRINVGIPGTGLSYSHKVGGKKKGNSSAASRKYSSSDASAHINSTENKQVYVSDAEGNAILIGFGLVVATFVILWIAASFAVALVVGVLLFFALVLVVSIKERVRPTPKEKGIGYDPSVSNDTPDSGQEVSTGTLAISLGEVRPHVAVRGTLPNEARHFELIPLIQEFYSSGDYDVCEEYCLEDINIYPAYIEEMQSRGDAKYLPRSFVSFETLCKIYQKQGRYDEAIKICDIAIGHGIGDGTKGGFEGRKKRLEGLQKKG